MKRGGINANRRLLGGSNPNIISNELENINTQTQSATLFKAVVIDVVSDPFSLTNDQLEEIAQSVNNPELVDVMPVNSVIAKIISNSGGLSTNACTILFPLYQSHIMFPINPGEIVYVIYEDYKDTGGKVGYWLTRTIGQRTTEDVNYTHLDRRFDPTMNPANYSIYEKTKLTEATVPPDFQNGGGTEETYTLPILKKGENPFDTLVKESLVKNMITFEPVPRWKKRPGEFVLQGSNNTLLCFGEDRSGPLENTADAKGFAGTIDIVAGRGRFLPKSDNEDPKETSPRIVTNSRGNQETDKAPYRKGMSRKDNPREGDPDFVNDAARLYVSMQTEADTKFKINLNSVNSLKLPTLPTGGVFGKSHIVGKADHIRMIARQSNEHDIKGTILLVREGKPNQDLGYFYIDSDGHIQIESQKIYNGKATGEKEPMILYTNYEETIKSLQNQISTLTSMVETAFAGAIGNLGSPIPNLLAVGSGKTITAALSADKTKVTNNTVPKQHSGKIFNDPERG